MNLSDVELERWLRAACPPIEPAPPLRRLVLGAAPSARKREGRRTAGRVLRLFVPFAAGILSVFAAQRWAGGGGKGAPAVPDASDKNVPGTFLSEGMFERIADRAPPPAVGEPAPSPAAGTEMASAPVPRIS